MILLYIIRVKHHAGLPTWSSHHVGDLHEDVPSDGSEALCCQLQDLELTSQTTDFVASSFPKYSQALQRLPLLQADFETAQHSHEVLQRWQHM